MNQKRAIKYLIIGIVISCVLLLLYIRADRIEKNYQFRGTIEKITYGDKKTPNVVIKGEIYFITYPNEGFNNKIEQGDSLIKEKNSRCYKLIKHKTKEVILSE